MIAVAIDGPAGAGKSTIARNAAKALGFIYVDTGALYRAISLFMLQNQVDVTDAQAVASQLPKVQVALAFQDGEQHVLLCGKDVSAAIRTPEVSMATAKVAAIPEVRSFLLQLQKDMAKQHNILMDGRDIGTVVLPDAQVKIFLTASAEERAKRRFRELEEKQVSVTFAEVLRDIEARDDQDYHREVAPLKQAEDAVLLDTSQLTLEESIAAVTSLITNYLKTHQ
ncbi:MAG: (d)CMP kinase [Oscillospiraceae bacterium]|nr:(d)CMP kinase [Oscillospiraceae bacterium]